MSTQRQKDSLVVLLDDLSAAGFNAVIFQVRTECDALYESPLEPWSYWLTGTQGTAPNPPYDPLTFVISEARVRGMELHAWFNPYRAHREDVSYPLHSSHVTQQHPDWVLTCPDGYKFLDPGLPSVRDYVVQVVADVVRRYDIDGVHFDDYFYPYSEHQFTRQDSLTWVAFPRGFPWDSLASWRRDNVNLLIRQVYDTVHAIKPWVKFGVSPFGIWRSGVPPGISGTSAYESIYCDALAWLLGQYVDYIVPQLYWKFGGGQDYALLQPWWASQRNGRHFYSGHADYQIANSGWPASEIANQIRFNQTTENTQGSVHYSAYNFRTNDGGIADLLKGDVFRYPSLVPSMTWQDTLPPNHPQNLQIAFNSSIARYELQWQSPEAAADGDTAIRYSVYRFLSPSYQTDDLNNPRNLITIAGGSTVIPPARIDSTDAQYYYAVASLDRNYNESALSNLVTISGPLTAPALSTPSDGEQQYAKGERLTWQPVSGATLYRVQLDSTGLFTPGKLLLNVQTPDTFAVPVNLKAQKTYYWRVIAGSQLAESPLSNSRAFRTGWPLPPVLISPVNVSNVPRNPTFTWRKGGGSSFHLRVVDYVTRVTMIDTLVTDTVFTSTVILVASQLHTWNVAAINDAGESDWSAEGRFRTGTTISQVKPDEGLPDRYELAQNFPNPFNPTTTIPFSLPERTHVTLKVLTVLGNEVATLIDESMPAGYWKAEFHAETLASGVYFFQLRTGQFVATKKMLLLR